MKIKFLPLIAVLFAATSIMTSCLDNDVEQITYTSETSITGFSLGTLHIDRVGKDKDGKDSALDCSNYPFTINQLTREIENKDSLPYGTHINKVITNVTYDAGILVYKPKGAEKDTLWTSTDSIDFSGDTYCTSTNKNSPIEFKVWAYSNAIGQAYKVKINVHQQIPDTIAWKKFDNSFSNGNLSKQKAVYANGKVYVFGKNGDDTHIEYSDVANDNPSSWIPVTINITDVDTYSATAWAGNIYFLAGATNDKQLYKLSVTTNEIELVSTETFEMLIGGNDIKSELYTVKGGKTGIYKENTWTEDANPFTLFPAGKPFFSNTTTASYNSDITTTIALCNNPTANDTAALVFNRISSDNKWEERIQNLPLPNLENVTMIYYDGKLYAFGGGYGEIKPFSQFYCSTDNGLCWRPVTECMAFPAEFSELYTAHSKNYSCAVTPKLENETYRGNFIWIVWEDGSICRGRINRLGFTPKW